MNIIKNNFLLDLNLEEHSYFYGFALADGSLLSFTRNRGRLSIEIKDRDKDILCKIQSSLPWKSSILTRTRKSPFNPTIEFTSCNLKYYSLDLRLQLQNLGFPVGKKSNVCKCPVGPYNEKAFWRGYIDGDGSLGFCKKGKPFISLVTDSEQIKDSYIKFISSKKNPSRNIRDSIYNISVTGKPAVGIVKLLYNDCNIYMDRKKIIADKIIA